jgi:hypothetical protein
MIIDEPAQQLAYDWMSLIRAYLDNQPPSDDNTKVERIARKYKMNHLIDGVSYRQGANGMMMKCIFREEGIKLLEDVYTRVYVDHTHHGARSSVKLSGTDFTGLPRRMMQ